jgi:hypothetical protein
MRPRLTSDVIRRFNRDTGWLATLVVGALVFAVLVLAALVQERYPKADDLTEAAIQTEPGLLLNGKGSTDKLTSGQPSTVDHAFAESSPQQNPSSQTEVAASSSTPTLPFTREMKGQDASSIEDTWTPANPQDSGRVIGSKVSRARFRSSLRPRIVDVKMRLIALWHQSLVRSEKSRTWTHLTQAKPWAKFSWRFGP